MVVEVADLSIYICFERVIVSFSNLKMFTALKGSKVGSLISAFCKKLDLSLDFCSIDQVSASGGVGLLKVSKKLSINRT